MTIRDIQKLSDEELRELSMQKGKNGCATRDADLAQQVRQERSGYWPGVARRTTQEATIARERGNGFTKKFK